jgi:hypothetical protein
VHAQHHGPEIPGEGDLASRMYPSMG